MGYLNPVEVMGYAGFAAAAAGAGVDGVITVDLPPEEADEYMRALGEHGIDPVFLLSPTSGDERIRRICAASGGFVYYVSLRGVTGAGNLDLREVEAKVEHIRSLTELPVGVGFGINSAEAAARVARFADAVIVGSAVVKRVAAHVDRPADIEADVAAFLAELRRAIDSARTNPAVTTA
jgi:tryptophan synthase alpha chain